MGLLCATQRGDCGSDTELHFKECPPLSVIGLSWIFRVSPFFSGECLFGGAWADAHCLVNWTLYQDILNGRGYSGKRVERSIVCRTKKWRCHMNVAAPVLCSGGSISCGNVMLCELLLWTVTRKQQFVGKVQCCWLFGCMCRS